MITVTGTNGFGSYNKAIFFSVPIEKAQVLHQDCWHYVRDKGERSVFRFDFADIDRSDDETSFHILLALLPSGLTEAINLEKQDRLVLVKT